MTSTASTTAAESVPDRSTGRRRAPRTLLWCAAAVVIAAVFLFPVYWAVMSSFKTAAEANTAPLAWLPTQPSVENYTRITDIGGGGVFIALGNSALVAVAAIVVTVVCSTCAGYAFSRFRFPLSNVAFLLILLSLMIPFQSILIPLYVELQAIGLGSSLVGLALVYATFQLPFSIFVMRNSFDQVPKELDEAATVDGAGSLRTLLSVLVPAAWPGVMTVVLFCFLFAWNEFLAALVLVGDPARFTVPVLLNLINANQFGTVVWGELQAGVVVAIVPSALVFLLLQRYYVSGATAGSLKG